MERLRTRDLLALLACLCDLYALQDLDAFWDRAISTIPRLVDSEITTYNEIDPVHHRTRTTAYPEGATDFADSHEIFARLVHQHPLVEHYRRTRDGHALKITDMVPQTVFRQLGLYQDFFRPAGVDRQIAITVPSSAPLVTGIALNRLGLDFTERDLLLLDQLRPHLVQAYENAMAATEALRDLQAIGKALWDSDSALIALSDDGRVRLMSDRARALLRKFVGDESMAGDQLPDLVRRWVRHRLGDFEADSAVPAPLTAITIRNENARLELRLMTGGPEGRPVLVLDENAVPPPVTVKDLLTGREREVMLLVARGSSNT